MVTNVVRKVHKRLGIASEDVEALRATYRTEDGIVAFVREVLRVPKIAPYQEDILRMVVRHRRVAVRGPHGLGKTTVAAWCVLWAISVFDDVKVPTTASKWRQLTKYLWPEIKKWARKADWSRLGINMRRGKELLELSIRVPQGEAFALTSDDPTAIEGAHASVLFYVFDEAKAIPNDLWDSAEGAFSGAGEDTDMLAFAFAISTPGTTSGRFYEIHTRKPGTEDWAVRHVKLEEAIAAGRISRKWADQRKRQWGEKSGVYKNRVLGDFDDSGEDNVVPLAWVEAANDRWYECEGEGKGFISIGVDVARYGDDKTTIARLVGRVLEKIEYYTKESTMQTTGRVIVAVGANQSIPIVVDTTPMGAGVYDRLQEQGYRVIEFNGGARTNLKDASGVIGFVNLRSAAWWMVREALDPEGDNPIALPPDNLLTGDLTAPLYWYTSDGRIQVESKDEIKPRIGRSTDSADAVMQALYAIVMIVATEIVPLPGREERERLSKSAKRGAIDFMKTTEQINAERLAALEAEAGEGLM